MRSYTNETFEFLRQLRDNNNRDWYNANKATCTQLRKLFEANVETLISAIGTFDPDVAFLAPSKAIFRLFRDTRFSHDKTPYKTHFGAVISDIGRKSTKVCYYIQVSPGNSFVAGGIWSPQPPTLRKLREGIFTQLDQLLEIIDQPPFNQHFTTFEGERLKRVPTIYNNQGFARPDLLQLKGLFVIHPLADELFEDDSWITETVRLCRIIYPLNRFINSYI